MPPQIWSFFRNHNQMSDARLDEPLTPGADVALTCRIRLDWQDLFLHPTNAHTMTATTAMTAPTTMAMSAFDVR